MSSLRTFKTFLAVARLGSFASAGREVGLTPAAVGLRVRALEESLGQPLFERGSRAVMLNAQGRQMVAQIEDLVHRIESLAEQADPNELGGEVVMGALVSALMGAFADALWSIKRAHPRLNVRLFGGQSSDFAERVARGELDAAVVAQAPRGLPASLLWTPLYSEPMVLIVPRRPGFALPRTPQKIMSEAPFIRFDRQAWTGHLVEEVLRQSGVSARNEMELNSVEAIVELVRQGFGVSVVPRLANVDWDQDGGLRVIRLRGVTVQRHVGLLERRQHGRMLFTAEIKRYFKSQGPG